ncbi:P-loop containing nucleoside triphosphate hydrolase protein [Metschnikowia bicuspidata]|uniref:P-loop containing nucleoside triphosphate hydrolase protein n=1 Tax=Metschnikowia bicuspidata TaxID=27322 RepID=A0A4P9ZAZ7_9ASCO|nr:P-loop containing nucleoside triphosphate hydrolase protein [Metschnikowia bicuspidata]
MRSSLPLRSHKYLVSSVPKAPVVVEPLITSPAKNSIVDLSSLVWDALDLNAYYKFLSFEEPLAAQLNKADSHFQLQKTKHEWTHALYSEIPDVKVRRMEMERRRKLDLIEPYKWNEYHQNHQLSRTSFGVEPLILKPLPEVLFVGHTNAGKSSLMNNIFASKQLAKQPSSDTDLAFESRKAGYTECLVCFNVNQKLRLVDSPGYGIRSVDNQGTLVMDYIKQRLQLKKTYIIVDGCFGFREGDELIMNYLQDNKYPFEIVFTKLDEVVKKRFPRNIVKKSTLVDEATASQLAAEGNSLVVEHFLEIMGNANLVDFPMLSGIHFNNSRCNNILKRRSGYREFRASIMKMCGLL